jgi:hypothetical protein
LPRQYAQEELLEHADELGKASRMFATRVLCSARRDVAVTFEQHIFQKITAGGFLA